MALGLNIVVGFAGLLDLGYVAFYAIGAYTVGWFASDHFSAVNGEKGIHVGVSEFVAQPARHPPELPARSARRGDHRRAIAGAIIGLPTLRLRGDYIAIVTLAFGEIIGRFARQRRRDQHRRRLQAHQRPPGDHADRPDRPAVPRPVQLGVRPAARTTGSCSCSLALVAVRELPPARLAPRPRLDRDPRGRGRRGVDGRPARARRSCWPTRSARRSAASSGAFLGLLPTTVNADQFQFAFSIFVLAMIILGGLGSIWGVVARRGAAVVHQHATHPRRAQQRAATRSAWTSTSRSLSFGIFGFLLVLVMVLRPQGLLPERRRKIELTEGIGAGRDAVECAGCRHELAPACDARCCAARASVSKVFGGLVAVNDVTFDHPERSRSSRSSAPTAPARRRSSTC